jgi:hypothetical protein
MARAGQIPCVELPDGSLVFEVGQLVEWLRARKPAGQGGRDDVE